MLAVRSQVEEDRHGVLLFGLLPFPPIHTVRAALKNRNSSIYLVAVAGLLFGRRYLARNLYPAVRNLSGGLEGVAPLLSRLL
jgi:hypothetical protein